MKIAKKMSAVALSLGLAVGVSGLTSALSGTISDTGPYSTNKIKSKVITHVDVHNKNRVNATSNNAQTASTGNADVSLNTTGGDATSGAAANSNSFDLSATVDNSGAGAAVASAVDPGAGSGAATIETTGPFSTNVVKDVTVTKVEVSNHNTFNVTSNNAQTATSGNASVSLNTTGGSATSGDATNTNSSSVTIDVTN